MSSPNPQGWRWHQSASRSNTDRLKGKSYPQGQLFKTSFQTKTLLLILHQPSKLFISHLIRFARMRNYLQFGLRSCLKPSIHWYDQRDPYRHANSVLISRGNAKSFFFFLPPWFAGHGTLCNLHYHTVGKDSEANNTVILATLICSDKARRCRPVISVCMSPNPD